MSNSLTRRSFTESLVLAALAPTFRLPSGAMASPWPESMTPLAAADEPGALAKALAGAVRAQYGARLSRAELATISRQIQAGLDRAAEIRKVDLANADEPAFVFSALPPEPVTP